jgi:hypothetical protein
MPKFSSLAPEIQEKLIASVDGRWAQLYGMERDWGAKVYKYLLLTNSGGAIALLSFLGTDKAPKVLAAKLALMCFVLGVVMLGVAVAHRYVRVSRLFDTYQRDAGEYFADQIDHKELRERDKQRYTRKSWLQRGLPYSCFALFITGCIWGGWALFSAPVQSN